MDIIEWITDDLVALHDAVVGSAQDAMIPFDKYWQIGQKILTEITPFVDCPYDIEPLSHVQSYLQLAMTPATVDGESMKNFEQQQQQQRSNSAIRLIRLFLHYAIFG
jgi:hypothetical protein